MSRTQFRMPNSATETTETEIKRNLWRCVDIWEPGGVLDQEAEALGQQRDGGPVPKIDAFFYWRALEKGLIKPTP